MSMVATEPAPRELSRKRFDEALARGEFLVGAAIGAGILGYSAELGGADFVMALNAGRFRLMGAASVACMLPIRNANPFVESFAPTELLSQCSVPVYFGASTMDPRTSVEEIVGHIAEMGFPGVINFPTVAHFSQPIQKALEASGLGFSKELSLLTKAQSNGLSGLAHVRNKDQVQAAAAAGIDLIIYNFGWNTGGDKGLASDLSVEEAAAHAHELARIVAKENPESYFMLEGGPIKDPEHLTEICRIANIHGYAGGSTLDRLPLAESVKDQTLRFKSAARLAKSVSRREADLVRFGRKIGLHGRSKAMIDVYETIQRFLGSEEALLVSGERGTGRQSTAEALHSQAGRCGEALSVVDASESSGQQLMISIFGRSSAGGQSRTLTGLAARDDVDAIVIRGLEHIPLKMQARIAVYLERGRFRPIGARRMVVSGTRLLFVAEKPMADLRAQKLIDPDLADRLEGHEVRMPSLRDRPEDVEALLEQAINRLTDRKEGAEKPLVSPSALRKLRRHDWHGNLPELRALASRMVSRYAGLRVDEIAVQHLLAGEGDAGKRRPASERDLILDALWRHGFNRGKTADFLGVSRKTLYNKIKRYGLTGTA